MKKILVAIDFSAGSEIAAEYAVHFSSNFKGVEIILYNAYDKDENAEGEGSIKYLRLARLRELGSKIAKDDKNLVFIAEQGAFTTAVEKYITENNIDLFIIGNNKEDAHSKTNLSETNIATIIGKVNIPVMIIPPHANLNEIVPQVIL